jgi:NhaP-type Na+/H+ or K+/H+ antiporter
MPVPADNALMVAGALLIGGVIVSRVAEQLRLPRLTGHMLAGIALGALGLVSNETRITLLEIERIVACAIAFFVGSLIGWRDLRVNARTVRLLVPCALLTVITAACFAGAVVARRNLGVQVLWSVRRWR